MRRVEREASNECVVGILDAGVGVRGSGDVERKGSGSVGTCEGDDDSGARL